MITKRTRLTVDPALLFPHGSPTTRAAVVELAELQGTNPEGQRVLSVHDNLNSLSSLIDSTHEFHCIFPLLRSKTMWFGNAVSRNSAPIDCFLLVLQTKIVQYFDGRLLGSSAAEPEQKRKADRKAAPPPMVDSFTAGRFFHVCSA
jgi:hypothetical protein